MVLRLDFYGKGRDIPQAVDQSHHTGPADQSEHSVLFKRRGFIETGTKQYYRQTGRRGAATLENMREVKCFHENRI